MTRRASRQTPQNRTPAFILWLRIVLLALIVPAAAPAASAADQASADCSNSRDAARQVEGCTNLLGRAGLSRRNKAVAHNNRGFVLLRQHELDRAISDFTSAIQADPRYGRAYLNRYAARIAKDDKKGALADIESWLQIVKTDRSFADALAYATNLGKAASLQQELHRWAAAAPRWEAAVSLLEGQLGAEAKLVLEAKLGLAQVYSELSRYDDAAKLVQAIISVKEKALGLDHPELVELLNELAIADLGKARFAESESLAKRALAIAERSAGPESDAVVTVLGNLAVVYYETRQFGDALDIQRRVLSIEEKLYGSESDQFSQTQGNLGNIYSAIGRYSEAERSLRRAIEISEKLHGADDPSVARELSNLGSMLSEEERYGEAEASFKRALVISERAFGPDNENVALILSNFGAVLAKQSRWAEAEALFSRALAIEEQTYGTDHRDVATVLHNLSRVLDEQGRKDDASRAMRQASAIIEKAYGPRSPELASILVEAGLRAVASHDRGAAERSLPRALDILKELAPEPMTLAEIAKVKAALSKGRGDLAEAETQYAAFLNLQIKTFGQAFPGSVLTLSTLASLAEQRHDWRRALDLLRRGSDVALRAGGDSSNDQAARLQATVTAQLARAAWNVASEAHEDAGVLSGEAFVAAQRTQRGRAAAAVAQMAARFGAGSAAVAAAAREQQDLSEHSRALDKALAAALGSTDAKKHSGVVLANLRTQITDVATRLEAVNARIARDFPQFAELTSPKPLSVADTKSLLRPDEALVTWLVLDEETFVFAVTHERSDWHRIDLGNKQLDGAVAKLRASLDYGGVSHAIASGQRGREVVFNLGAAHELYEKLLGPVQGLIETKKTLLVVPAGALTSLPLQVLVTEAPKRAATSLSDTAYRDAAWLAKSHAIVVLPSVTSLRALRAFAKRSQASKPLVGFADPVFGRDADGKPVRGGATRGTLVGGYARYFRGGEVDVDALRHGLPALPETADELRAVAKQLGAPETDLEIGEKATVPEVKALPLDRYRVVYFATHGLVAGDVQGLTEPALALTIPAHPTEADSGLLTASDVAQLKLDSDWVVLSACNTAAGEKPGAEGLSGLARAFFYAGARALLVSHWPVQSDAAVKLTTKTFAALAADPKLGRSEALRRAMLTLVEAGGESAYPAVWAPFVVVGEDAR